MRQLQIALMMGVLWTLNPVQAEIINEESTNCGNDYYYFRQVCDGDDIFFNGEQLWVSGTYYAPLKDQNGCDSLVTLEVQFLPIVKKEFQMPICSGDTLRLAGQEITSEGKYTLTYTSSWGCDSLVILYIFEQSGIITNDQRSICHGDSLFFNNSWIQTEGNYEARYTHSNGCDSVVKLQLQVIKPETEVTVDGQLLRAKAVADSYQWYTCPQYTLIPEATHQEFNAEQAGDYALRIESKGCVDTSTCFYIPMNTTGWEASFDSETTWVYPNPAYDRTTIEWNESRNGELLLLDLSGRLIQQITFTDTQQLTLDLSGLVEGLYLISIQTEFGIESHKLQIQ